MTESSKGALRSVLIVTGSDRTRRMYAEYLGWRGIDVHEVDGAAAAVRALASFRPDVVVTEDRLPDSTGQELLRALRRSRFTFDLPLVLLSSDTFDSAASALQQGCNRVLMVPLLPESLHDALQDVVRDCRHIRETRAFESWLFTRDGESVWIVRTGDLELSVAGPGTGRGVFTFGFERELQSFQAEYEQRLVLTGFVLQSLGDDRRSGRDRRTAPRPGVTDRRAVQ